MGIALEHLETSGTKVLGMDLLHAYAIWKTENIERSFKHIGACPELCSLYISSTGEQGMQDQGNYGTCDIKLHFWSVKKSNGEPL